MRFKILGILSFVILLLIFGSSVAFAQENPEQIAKKYGVTFPIADLGGCVDYSSCRVYCEDPVNHSTCIDFAKKKGFYKEESIQEKSSVIASARKELGCDSEISCREFCGSQSNWEKCGEFAKRHKINGGHTEDLKKAEILEKAKVELGCSSHEECMSFCHEEANRQKCSDFAKKTGLRGGEHRVGPGGCNSEETCRTFCSDPNNFQECSKFGGGIEGSSGGGFHGPGGCNSEDSCRAYCEKNPQDCKIITSGEHGGAQDPRRASEEYAKYCRENPERCATGAQGPFRNKDAREEFEKFCTANPDKCAGGAHNLDQATECVKYGCSWTGTNCQCNEGKYSSPTYAPHASPPPEDYSTGSTGCVQAGCTWNGTSCSCGGTSGTSGGSSPTPPPDSTPSYITPSAYETPSNPTP